MQTVWPVRVKSSVLLSCNPVWDWVTIGTTFIHLFRFLSSVLLPFILYFFNFFFLTSLVSFMLFLSVAPSTRKHTNHGPPSDTIIHTLAHHPFRGTQRKAGDIVIHNNICSSELDRMCGMSYISQLGLFISTHLAARNPILQRFLTATLQKQVLIY